MEKKEYSIDVGGKTLTAQFTDMTDQAHGSVIVRYGDTTVLATAVMSEQKREGMNYFPLSVDFEERFYAAGQILGSRFMRREGRPSDRAVLSARIVDRTIRPLFNQEMRNDIQVVITVLSIDKDDPDVLAINAASLALATSDIPWDGPVSAVRINGEGNGLKNLVINPTYEEREGTQFNTVACGKDGRINMIETEGDEINEDDVTETFKKASEEIEKLQEWQKKIVKEIGKEKRQIEIEKASKEMTDLFEKEIEGKLLETVFSGPGKGGVLKLKGEWKDMVKETLPEENPSLAGMLYEEKVDELLHKEALENDKRADGRKMDELRQIQAKAGDISAILHGSGLFYRGGTHILSVLTLGGPDDMQLIEGMEVQEKKRFFHHYNFPPYSVGETGRVGGFNRRQIGHGALAERALSYVLPPADEFPYTIRIVSEALASNGSTSMGSVCGGTLALMDAGVPIKAPVAGIAMGLMMDESGKYKILTDIQGPEDHHGDMDFKVAGTRNGVNAIQMDVKVGGIPIEILTEALGKAKEARLQILDVIEAEIKEPRANISPNAPEILITKIKPDQIGLIIGGGGKTINDIRDRTETEITIEEDGSVFITGKGGGAQKAKDIIDGMTREYKSGEKFDGEVVKVLDFGVFVRINPWAEGLVHVSEIAPFRIENVGSILKEGDKVPVEVKEVDDKGRINLSIKRANPDLFKDLAPKAKDNGREQKN
jgi:polyribonucleotide nucleotidyltransferase